MTYCIKMVGVGLLLTGRQVVVQHLVARAGGKAVEPERVRFLQFCYFMVQSLSLVSQEISVYYGSPLIPTLKQMNLGHALTSCSFNTRFRIVFSSKSRSSKRSLSFSFNNLYVAHMCRPPQPPRFYFCNNIWRGIKITKIFSMQFSPVTSFLFFFLNPIVYLSTIFLQVYKHRTLPYLQSALLAV